MPGKNNLIAGVDEVGKGCLFGPVFAAAVILNQSSEKNLLEKGLNDSKIISPAKREKLAPIIKNLAISWGIGQASSREIDTFGIREATDRAMIRALQKLCESIDLVLVDGLLPIRSWEGKQTTVIKGDCIHPCISAASIIAKQSRDNLLKRLSIKFPGYGLEKNFGYGTNFHRDAIRKLGPSNIHRLSFLSKIIN